jgi:hypothetical protein
MSTEPDTDDLLTPQPGGPSPALREDLLRRTERVLRRAVWLGRAWKAAAVALVFILGGAAGWFARPERERVVEVTGETRVVVVPVILPLPASGSAAPASPQQPLSASEAELRAEQADDRAEAAKLYRVAGDAFLRDQDYPNATRCYRLFLVRAGDGGLSPEPDDSWLLTSLKNAAFKEKIDVPKIDG